MSISEKDAVLRERAAFLRGVTELFIEDDIPSGADISAAVERVEARVEKRYPLPKVTRPRVVRDTTGQWGVYDWRVFNGALEYRDINNTKWIPVDPHGSGMYVYAERVKLLADLLANPTEEVDA